MVPKGLQTLRFLDNNLIVITLKSDTLGLYYYSKDESEQVSLPQNQFQYMELSDVKKFHDFFYNLFTTKNIKGEKIVILIDPSLYFENDVAVGSSKEVIPFNLPETFLSVKGKNYICDGNIIHALKEICKDNRNNILGIFPNNGGLIYKKSEIKYAKLMNFIHKFSNVPQPSFVKIYIGILILSFVILGVAFSFRETEPLPPTDNLRVNRVTDVKQSTASSIAEITFAKKSDIKVTVLNGSGISGVAAKAKSKLEPLGFSEILTGNNEETVSTAELFKSVTVSDEVANEVKSALGISEVDFVNEDASAPFIKIVLSK